MKKDKITKARRIAELERKLFEAEATCIHCRWIGRRDQLVMEEGT